jgi:asparagine synthase (glutamine-hydrolysing)
MLRRTRHPSVVCELPARDVPALAESLQAHLDQPFGGLPTLAYGRLFERARSEGVIVLLDGQGMDEQWAGYDYYDATPASAPVVQGSRDSAVRPQCLVPEFRAEAERFEMPQRFSDAVTNLQYRDARFTKIPRALRFNDGISMRVSTELREPFMDHRLFELALRQPTGRKVLNGRRKVLLRDVMSCLLGAPMVEAPKRPLQTPQREWLRGPLRDWAETLFDERRLDEAGLLSSRTIRHLWRQHLSGTHNRERVLWALLMFQAWQEHWCRGAPSAASSSSTLPS